MERLVLLRGESVVKSLEDGSRLRIHTIIPIRPVPGLTAEHEAAHITAAGRIKSATIIPSGKALGTTVPEKMTAATAGAAAALGHDGVGWDLFIAEYALGVPRSAAIAAGRSALAGKDEEMHEVATLLEERKSITQTDVEEGRENVSLRRNGIFPVEVEHMSSDGRLRKFKTQSTHNVVLIEDEWTRLKAA